MTSADMHCDGLLLNCRLATLDHDGAPYGTLEGAAIGWKDGTLRYVGLMASLSPAATSSAAAVSDAKGRWITPALVDCHTHLVFAGNRAAEFEQRLGGASYEDIARSGGGILSTVRATRAATFDALFDAAMPRALALRNDGVGTVEIKSGYGLDLGNERKMLQVARAIGIASGVSVRTTFLAAHALPPEFQGQPDAYIEAACEWLRTLHGEGLIDAVDAFCEGIGFSVAQTSRVFEAASALGLPVKLHADQLSDLGGAALCARFRGLSADHIEHSSEASIAAMAASGTVAVLLPGAFHVLRETRVPPVDALRRHGVPMAVSTDLNPGTSPLQSLRLAMSLACTHFQLTPEEALRGATMHAARALGLADRGILRVGLRADLAEWDIGQPAELCYWLGGNPLKRLILGGTQREFTGRPE